MPSFLKQTKVYFKKVSRIAMREKAWKFVAFAVVIAFAVAYVSHDGMFENYDDTQVGFFTIASACIWIGIFNSIQSICKEHDVIRSEYRQGGMISSYIFANAMWQAVLCFAQSIVVFILCNIFIDFPDEGVVFNARIEIFITLFILTFGSAVLGIMVSSISSTPTTAMTIMPFVLILQLIMSGVLFSLEGLCDKIAYITFSKWGMSALGCIADLNSPSLPLKINAVYPDVVRTNYNEAYDHVSSNLYESWLACIMIIALAIVISIVSLKIKNRES